MSSRQRQSNGRRRARRGVALVSAMMMVMMMIMMATAMLSLAATNIRTAYRRTLNSQALNLAMGGLDEGAKQVKNDLSWGGFTDRTLGPGTLTVTVTTPLLYPTRRVITATGTVTRGDLTVSKSCRTTMDESGVADVFYYAIAAKDDFTLGGAITVDSYPSLHVGDIHCNADTTHNGGGSGMTDGKSTATGTIYQSGSPTITGGATSGVPPMTFPEIDATLKAQALANGIYIGNKTVSDGSVLKGKIVGNLTVSGSGCTVSGVVWVTGTVTISGPMNGTGTILTDGAMTINSRTYDERSDTATIAYITTSTASPAISVTGNRSLKGILYAPDGEIRFQGGSTFYGCALAKTVTFGGNPHITRWTGWQSSAPPLPKDYEVKGWEEL